MKRLAIFLLIFVFVLCLAGCSKEAASIGIIGGADGPTAIFITSNINWLQVCGWIGVMVVAVVVALMIYRNKKK